MIKILWKQTFTKFWFKEFLNQLYDIADKVKAFKSD